MTDRKPLDDMTSDDLDQLWAELDALRTVARGYCPACGRGDAAPSVADWEQQKQRADQAEQQLTQIRDRAASLHARGIDAMSAAFIIGFIDGVSEPARTTANNPPASEETP